MKVPSSKPRTTLILERYGALLHKSGFIIIMTINTGLGSGVFYDGQLIPNFKLGHLLWKEGKVIEKYAVDSVRKQENLEFDKWEKD